MTKILLIKIITPKMDKITPQHLIIYKFQPNNIIMIHKTTKHLYQYFQTPIKKQKSNNPFHEHLLTAKFLPTGIIYPKGITTMQNQISKRIKATVKHTYQQQELINTFQPLLSCVKYLHSQNVIHGSICPQNIIFTEEGNVLLRDWILEIANNKYYEPLNGKESTKSDDMCALGQIMYEASTLTQFIQQSQAHLNFDNLFSKLIPKYSRGYILGIYIMIRKLQNYYPHLENILKNNQSYIDGSESLVSMFKKIKGEKQLKTTVTPILNYNNFKSIDSKAKLSINPKKNSKKEDVQNIRVFDQLRKKNIDRVTKIIQKNTNNQVINKVDMVLKKINNLRPSNLQENYNNSQKTTTKEEILKFNTPLKRLKTFSKRKAF